MNTLVTVPLILALLLLMGAVALYLEVREREERLVTQSLETAKLLDASLEEQLAEIDAYRHDLAALLQDIDPERLRQAEQRSGDSPLNVRGTVPSTSGGQSPRR